MLLEISVRFDMLDDYSIHVLCNNLYDQGVKCVECCTENYVSKITLRNRTGSTFNCQFSTDENGPYNKRLSFFIDKTSFQRLVGSVFNVENGTWFHFNVSQFSMLHRYLNPNFSLKLFSSLGQDNKFLCLTSDFVSNLRRVWGKQTKITK